MLVLAPGQWQAEPSSGDILIMFAASSNYCCVVWLRPGLYCCTSELVTSGDGPGPPVSDLGSGAVSAPLSQVVGFTHSRQCPSQGLLPAQSQGRPEFAWQTWNQFEPRGVILALLGSPLATSGAKLMLGLVPGQPGNSSPQHGLALARRF